MNVAAGPELAAAVSNAGGLGVIGGLGYTYVVFHSSALILIDRLMDSPKQLRNQIKEIKSGLKSPDLRAPLEVHQRCSADK